MAHWKDLVTVYDTRTFFTDYGKQIRSRALNLGRFQYSLGVAHGVMQAIHAGYEQIALVEFGVGLGGGLLELCDIAQHFRTTLGLDIAVYGFDNASGLPPPADYRDHPEIWSTGDYKLRSTEDLEKKLPKFCSLIIGDIANTVDGSANLFKQHRIGFVSIDVDYYSSAVPCLRLFQFDSDRYVPAVPVHFDETELFITYSDWSGEGLALREFNQQNTWRKIHRRLNFNIPQFHTCQILDHPLRSGAGKPRIPFNIAPF